MFIHFWKTETEHKQEWCGEKGGHRIWSRLQAPSHQPRARRGARTHRPQDRDLSWSRTLNWLSHPGAPLLGSSWSLSNSSSHFKMAKDLFRSFPKSLVQVFLKIWNVPCWGICLVMCLSPTSLRCVCFYQNDMDSIWFPDILKNSKILLSW